MRRSIACITGLALFVLPDLHAQEAREVRPGDRVRVTLASRIARAPLIGTLTELGPDTLVVEREGGGLRRLSSAQVDRIEVSIRRQYEGGKAAGYGVLAATPLLVLLAIAAPIIAAEGNDALVWAMLGAAVGGSLLVGALIGGTTPQDTWVEAHWPGEPGPSGVVDTLQDHRLPTDFREDP
jgi:hypothetical protein